MSTLSNDYDKTHLYVNHTNNTFDKNVLNDEINNNKLIMPCCGIIKDTGKLKDNILFTKIKNEDILIKSSNFLMYINIFIIDVYY